MVVNLLFIIATSFYNISNNLRFNSEEMYEKYIKFIDTKNEKLPEGEEKTEYLYS